MSKSKKKKIIIAIIVVLILLGSGVFYLSGKKKKIEYITAPVERGTLNQTVSVTGNLISDDEVRLNFEIPGRISKILIKKGDIVSRGDVLAVLDDSGLSIQAAQAKAALDKTMADAEINSDTLNEAEVAQENAERVLDDTKDLNKQNLQAADTAVENAKNARDDARAYYNQVIDDSGKDSASAKNVRITLTNAENNVEAAEEARETADRQADLNETNAKNSLETAKAHVATVKSEVGERSRNAAVENAREAYELALNNLKKSELRAPVTGTITDVAYESGEVFTAGVGEQVFGKMISSDMIIEAEVPESDILKVNTGQHATATFESLTSSDEFSADIVSIDPSSTVSQDVVDYKIKLRLNNKDLRLKAGMSTDVDVQIVSKENVLKIPLRAIKTQGNQKTVDVLEKNNEIRTVSIETGLEGDEAMVEVRAGLKEGENVVTFTKS